jgi:hypothetical protein
MLDGDRDVTIEHVLECAVVDDLGRLLVPMIDVLAIMRLAADAEVLVVRFCNGASTALRVPEIVESENVFLQLQLPEDPGADGAEWSAHVWTPEAGPSASIVSISAMSFASFVGLE